MLISFVAPQSILSVTLFFLDIYESIQLHIFTFLHLTKLYMSQFETQFKTNQIY